MPLSIGSKAPDFNLPASSGGKIALKDLRGKTVVLYFYPKDDTPGCTTEACGLRDSFKIFESLNAVILGVSPDSVDSHGKKWNERWLDHHHEWNSCYRRRYLRSRAR